MKTAMVVLAILLFATPAFAQFTPTVQPQGQMQTWPPAGQMPQSQPQQQYQQTPQMPQPHSLDDWHRATYPAQHPETYKPSQQEKINDQWRHSTVPGVSGIALPPPPGIGNGYVPDP